MGKPVKARYFHFRSALELNGWYCLYIRAIVEQLLQYITLATLYNRGYVHLLQAQSYFIANVTRGLCLLSCRMWDSFNLSTKVVSMPRYECYSLDICMFVVLPLLINEWLSTSWGHKAVSFVKMNMWYFLWSRQDISRQTFDGTS